MSTADTAIDRVREAAARVAHSHGLDLFDVQFRREATGWVLRVILDRPDPAAAGVATGARTADANSAAPGDARPAPDGAGGLNLPGSSGAPDAFGDPVGIEDCQRVSHDLSALLDVEDDLTAGWPTGYTLEVSSPGLDRPLRGEADYRRFTGRLAKIVTGEPVAGQSHFAGRLAGVDAGEVLLTEGRRTHRVPLGRIRRARLDVEF
jgi:ribosome maturation factor RimP